jgi:hypothetical protein
LKGRKAYAGTPATEIIKRLGFGGPLMDALADVYLDGEQLIALRETLRTPNRFEMRAETKYREAFAAAVAFSAIMGLKRLGISSVREDGSNRESPDLLLSSGDRVFDVEVVRIDETSAARAHLFEIQAHVASLLTDEPGLRPEPLTQFSLEYERFKSLNAAERDELAGELCDFFRARRWQLLSKGAHASVFPRDSMAGRVGIIVRIASPLYAAVLSCSQANGITPFPLILSEIEKKRRIQYISSHELWLVVEIADPRGPFIEAIDAVKDVAPEIVPFDHLIVYDPLTQHKAIF